MLERLKSWAGILKQETYTIYFAARDPRTPWYAKALAVFVAAHTLSPIDLIPDFIPVLGYLDDLIITPLGLMLALRMIPPEVLEQARTKAEHEILDRQSLGRWGLAIVISIWLLGLVLVCYLILKLLAHESLV